MKLAVCPYCSEPCQRKYIIDKGHLSTKNMQKTGNTRNIYLCPECNEVFEGFQKNKYIDKPLDTRFNRKFQYCHGNMIDIFNNDEDTFDIDFN